MHTVYAESARRHRDARVAAFSASVRAVAQACSWRRSWMMSPVLVGGEPAVATRLRQRSTEITRQPSTAFHRHGTRSILLVLVYPCDPVTTYNQVIFAMLWAVSLTVDDPTNAIVQASALTSRTTLMRIAGFMSIPTGDGSIRIAQSEHSDCRISMGFSDEVLTYYPGVSGEERARHPRGAPS